MNTHTPMHFRIGTVVLDGAKLGHVIGFARNPEGEAILSVAWDDGTTGPVHPDHVTLDPQEWPAPWSEEKTPRSFGGGVGRFWRG